jgi:catechol 2,3-dioxygenase-like lactoylglutathione lyase family enzyme
MCPGRHPAPTARTGDAPERGSALGGGPVGFHAIVIDHLNIGVADVAASRAFYERALAPLGYVVLMDRGYGVGFGKDGKPDFWISDRPTSAPLHVAFASPDRATVEAFHREALAAGGRDNGAPGLRPQYHPSYYGAFVLDPEGNNVEAVAHRPE